MVEGINFSSILMRFLTSFLLLQKSSVLSMSVCNGSLSGFSCGEFFSAGRNFQLIAAVLPDPWYKMGPSCLTAFFRRSSNVLWQWMALRVGYPRAVIRDQFVNAHFFLRFPLTFDDVSPLLYLLFQCRNMDFFFLLFWLFRKASAALSL